MLNEVIIWLFFHSPRVAVVNGAQRGAGVWKWECQWNDEALTETPHISWNICEYRRPLSGLDHNDGPFFSAMEWLMFFFRPPLTTMFFQWFYHHWTITIECSNEGPTIGFNVVFQWFLKFWGRLLTMVCMYHCTKKCVKSIRDKMQKVGT